MPDDRPNILHIFTDQQRFDTIAALGNPVIRTPNFDRLCREGTAFTSAYSASPVCISARCSMIYGQYAHNTGCYENQTMPTDDRRSVMGALTEAGYRTHGIGKCHFSPDSMALRGFQSREIQEEIAGYENDDYMQHLATRGQKTLEPHGIRGEMYYIPQPSMLPAEDHPTQWIGDRSVAFLEQQALDGEPWYLFSSYIHPHPPFAPPHPWYKLYRAPLMPLPKVPQDCEAGMWTWINRSQNRYKYRDQGIDQNLMRNMKAHYYACISFIDYQIGRLLDVLERTGQLDNTLILVNSDHGEHLGDMNCFGKRSMHDSAARVPMVVRLPDRFAAGDICDQVVGHVDVAPTLLGAAGAALGTHQPDGVDLADVAAGNVDREMVFSQLFSGEKAIYMAVSDGWKYMYSAGDGRAYLFDRVTDPQETRNRAGIWGLPQVAEAETYMREALMKFLREGGETAGLDGDEWREFPQIELDVNPDAGLLIQDARGDYSIPGYTDE
jgi:arylsulfatase